MKIKGRMSLSSRLWLDRQMNDPYVKRAHKEGYRSRAAYKLLEIDEKFNLIKRSKHIIDLGAAPGGWSQLLSQKSAEDTKIVAIDLLNFDELPKVQQFIGDFEDKENQQKIIGALGQKADLIVSDMAPSTVGHAQTDHLRIMNLVTSAYDFALNTLAPGGSFVAKIFMGGKEKQFFERVKRDFEKAYFFKPKSSRSVSVEIYIIGSKMILQPVISSPIQRYAEKSEKVVSDTKSKPEYQSIYNTGTGSFPSKSSDSSTYNNRLQELPGCGEIEKD